MISKETLSEDKKMPDGEGEARWETRSDPMWIPMEESAAACSQSVSSYPVRQSVSLLLVAEQTAPTHYH